MRVIPAYNDLCLIANFRQHFGDHLLLIYRIHTLHTDSCGHLGHCKYIYYFYLKAIIVKFSQHHAHNLKGYSKTAYMRNLSKIKEYNALSF